MITLLDLPPHIIEKIAADLESCYFPPESVSTVFSYFSTENYCRYLFGRKFVSKNCDDYDNLYINVFPKTVTADDTKKFRIVDSEFAIRVARSFSGVDMYYVCPLLRVWTGDLSLVISCGLSCGKFKFKSYSSSEVLFPDDYSKRLTQLEEDLNFHYTFRPGYQFFKKCDIDYVNDLAIKLNTNRYQERVTLRPLRPQLLTIHIDSPDPICSGKLVSEVVDLTNVVKFRLSLPGRCNTVAYWNSISEKLTRVQDLDIALGLIYNVWQFFDYAPKSISRFKITLYGCRRLDDETSESYKDHLLKNYHPPLTDDGIFEVHLPNSRR